MIHPVLHPSLKPLREDPEKLNRYFISTATRTLGTKPDSIHDLLDLFPTRLMNCPHFALRNVSRGEVLKQTSRLRSDCSTGVDQIPVKFVKLASDYLSGPLTYIINSCIILACSGRINYSRWELLRLKSKYYLSPDVYSTLKCLGILKTRRLRGGRPCYTES